MHGFKVGDVVRLKSGGPNMTVLKIVYKHVSVNWFANVVELKTAMFDGNMLVLVERDSKTENSKE